MRIARLVTAAAAATALVVFAGGAPAWAHNALTKAVPAKNATVKESPAKVELTFLDSLDDTFAIEVTDGQNQKVPTGKASIDGKTGTAAFTVAAPGPAATSASASPDPVVSSPAGPSAPATVAASDASRGGTDRALIVAVVAGVAVLVTGALLLGRRRKNP
jgi:LPXTG-motif cell wall-anchored protein